MTTESTPSTAGAVVKAATPTVGASIGAFVAMLVAPLLHIPGPIVGYFVAAVTSATTALFHWIGSKIGANL